jgi:transposase
VATPRRATDLKNLHHFLGHHRDGRSIYDPQARSDLVRASQQPGVSLARVARLCGINANVLGNWVRQHERSKGVDAAAQGEVIDMPVAPAFLAVQVDPAPAPAPAPAPPPEVALQVRLPNGVTLDMRVPDLDGASRLIEVLGRLRCSASTKP